MDASSTMPGLGALKQERGLPSSLESPFGGNSLSKKKPLASTMSAGLGADASFLSKNKCLPAPS